MKTTFPALAFSAVSLALASPSPALEGPRDFSDEPSMLEQQSRRDDHLRPLAQEPPDRPLIGDEPLTEEDWDMVKRLEKLRQKQADELMIERLMRDNLDEFMAPAPRDLQRAVATEGWLIGITVEPLDPFIRSHLDIPGDAGVKVTAVMPRSPAQLAGVKVDDILLSANKQKVTSLEELKEIVKRTGREEKPLRLELIRKGERETVVIQPAKPERKPEPRVPGDAGDPPRDEPGMGEVMRRLDQQQREIRELRRQLNQLKKRLEK